MCPCADIISQKSASVETSFKSSKLDVISNAGLNALCREILYQFLDDEPALTYLAKRKADLFHRLCTISRQKIALPFPQESTKYTTLDLLYQYVYIDSVNVCRNFCWPQHSDFE